MSPPAVCFIWLIAVFVSSKETTSQEAYFLKPVKAVLLTAPCHCSYVPHQCCTSQDLHKVLLPWSHTLYLTQLQKKPWFLPVLSWIFSCCLNKSCDPPRIVCSVQINIFSCSFHSSRPACFPDPILDHLIRQPFKNTAVCS